MLNLQDQGTCLCDGLTRRDWLRIGSLGMFGLTLPQLVKARQAAAATSSKHRPDKARACIVLFFLGGPPQHETWDPKPNAPAEIRGDLKPMASAVPGVQVGELMPKTARLLDRISILRGFATNDHSHSSSGYYVTTGYPHKPMGVENARPGAPNDWPSLGAPIQRTLPGQGGLPAAITLPEQMANDGNLTWPGQDAGFLGRTADPWVLNGDPSAPDFHVAGLALPADVSRTRFEARRGLAQQANERLDGLVRAGNLDLFDAQQLQALDLISASKARRAFNVHEEPLAVRERYGQTRFGQSTLLARRLVEAGVSLVRVNWTRVPGKLNSGHWDTHGNNTAGLKQLMPIMDQAYSALLEDLAQRGLLDETLVVWTGEFGRTPRINGSGGRDHWGGVFSVALAGGGVRGGVVHGASDRIGAYPRDGKVGPPDLLATVFHCFGIAPDSVYHDSLGRPLPLTRGEVIRAVL